jgi:hypothetical protein
MITVTIEPTGKRRYTSDTELWATADGRAVEAGDAAAVTLLVREGGSISGRDAARYGLLDAAEAALYPTDEERARREAEIVRAIETGTLDDLVKQALREGEAREGKKP